MAEDFHKLFPNSGQGKQYPWLLEQLQGEIAKPETVSLLDWGCGKGGTATWLEEQFPGIYIDRYDPYVEAYKGEEYRTRYYDIVYSCDVLEHIDKWDCVRKDGALAKINSATRSLALLIIDLTPAKKLLPDGRNAHINLQSEDAWLEDVSEWMDVEDWRTTEDPDKTYGVRRRICIRARRGKKM